MYNGVLIDLDSAKFHLYVGLSRPINYTREAFSAHNDTLFSDMT